MVVATNWMKMKLNYVLCINLKKWKWFPGILEQSFLLSKTDIIVRMRGNSFLLTLAQFSFAWYSETYTHNVCVCVCVCVCVSVCVCVCVFNLIYNNIYSLFSIVPKHFCQCSLKQTCTMIKSIAYYRLGEAMCITLKLLKSKHYIQNRIFYSNTP